MQKTDWTQLWLKYERKRDCGNGAYVAKAALKGFSAENRVIAHALEELNNGIHGMLGITVRMVSDPGEASLVLGNSTDRKKEGFSLREQEGVLTLSAADENGLLYGVFHLLRLIAMEKPLEGILQVVDPDDPLRMYDHWDNMDGSIERGYSGESFFFRQDEILVNRRTRDYARFVASIGINGVVINNVNVKQAATWLITERYFKDLAALSEIFADYGIRLYLSLNYAAPLELGGPDSADPLNPEVRHWWERKMEEVFAEIPNLGGFLVKADSEGRPGPFT